ncbi:hypothetical protein U728_783 [Clostridium botulinum 202F]|nr:hypothetical protein U728_783 [Clostridium botulinum 202F]
MRDELTRQVKNLDLTEIKMVFGNVEKVLLQQKIINKYGENLIVRNS